MSIGHGVGLGVSHEASQQSQYCILYTDTDMDGSLGGDYVHTYGVYIHVFEAVSMQILSRW